MGNIIIPSPATVFCLAGDQGNPANIPAQMSGEVVAGNTVELVTYKNTGLFLPCVKDGAAQADAAMQGVSGQKIWFAHSLGAVAAVYWMQNYASIDPSELLFVLIGNSVRPFGGWCGYVNWFPGVQYPAQVPWTVYDFATQYDKYADYPPGNNGGKAATKGTAVTNAEKSNYHGDYGDRSLNDPNNVTYQDPSGVTYIWSMSYPMPLAGNGKNQQTLDEQDRPVVEAQYSRPVTLPTPNYGAM